MATLLLLRHGRTTSNADGTLAGRTAVRLDDVGTAQALAVGERLRTLPLAAVVSSPLERCQQTLSLALPQASAELDERLTECGYGDWEGRALKQLVKEPLWPLVQAHPSAVTFPGLTGESMAAMSSRAIAAVRDWDDRVSRADGANALWLACSHGDVIKAIVADALGLHLDQFQRIVIEPGSVTVIRYTPVRPFLVRLNDSAGDLGQLVPPKRSRRRRARPADSDAAVGGGADAVGGGAGAV